jgi:hypothetical protein
VPAELDANRMQWLIRFCVIRGYVSVIWRSGMHRSLWLRCKVRYTWLCVCYVEAWCALIYLVTLPNALNVVMLMLCGGLVCTDLSGYVAKCVKRGYVSGLWRPGVHRSVWLRCQVR